MLSSMILVSSKVCNRPRRLDWQLLEQIWSKIKDFHCLSGLGRLRFLMGEQWDCWSLNCPFNQASCFPLCWQSVNLPKEPPSLHSDHATPVNLPLAPTDGELYIPRVPSILYALAFVKGELNESCVPSKPPLNPGNIHVLTIHICSMARIWKWKKGKEGMTLRQP